MIMESTARQMEIEEEIGRLEGVRDRYRTDLETEVKTLMSKLLKEIKDTEASAE